MLLTLPSPAKAYLSEFLGTALLLAGIVGSGIMGERLSGGNTAIALLANAIATGLLLPVLIHLFAPISGAHFNPLVSIAEYMEKRLPGSRIPGYLLMQFAGGILGVFAAHAMFGLPLLQASTHIRSGAAQCLSEGIATFGLLLLVLRRFSMPLGQIPWLIGAYIASAYWFTASTSFANPAVTVARAFTNTFSGVRVQDVPFFMASQVSGAVAALLLSRWMDSTEKVL